MVFTRASSSVWPPARTHPPKRVIPPSRKSLESTNRSRSRSRNLNLNPNCTRNKQRELTIKEEAANLRGLARTTRENFYSIRTRATRSPNFNSSAVSTQRRRTRTLTLVAGGTQQGTTPNQTNTSAVAGISATQRGRCTRSARKITRSSSSRSSSTRLRCSI